MASNRKLDDLFDNAELPFGHSGRNYDDTPVDFDEFKDSYEPPAVDPHEEGIVHYGPATGRSAGKSPSWPSTPTIPVR